VKKEVEFRSEGTLVRGTLILPAAAKSPVPAVVMGGGWCYVKEIVMPHYAKAIVAAGAAVLMFDYRHSGASEGEPRQLIDPARQIEDFKNAVTFVSGLPEIDGDNVGVWGISYAGGHVLAVGATDPRVKCVISNIPVVDGYENMRRVHGSTRFNELQALIMKDRVERARDGGAGGRMPMSSLKPFEELSTWPFQLIHEVFHDIKKREAPLHEHWSTISSTEMLLSYNVFPFAERMYNTPVMMVVAEGDEITLWDLEIKAFNSIPSPQKELVVIPHVSHMSLYSQQTHLQIAGASAARFVRKYLVEKSAATSVHAA
jgi:predicted acyl esterase